MAEDEIDVLAEDEIDVLAEDENSGAEDLVHALALLFALPRPLAPVAGFESDGSAAKNLQDLHTVYQPT